MGPLKNPRHERAVQEYIKGKSASEAYAIAFPSCSQAAAETAGPRLFRNVQVAARVAELTRKAADRTEITLQGQLEKAERLIGRAEELDQISAAVSALTLQCRLAGFLHDKPAAATGDTYNIAFIKAPPQETFEQFNERRTRELRLVGTAARPTNGSGRRDLVS